MCIWWNMSADFRVITTSVVDVHPISAVANSALCVICTNCGVLFVRFARFAALTLGLSTVPHFKLSIHSTFYFSVSRHSVKPGNATCCANVHPTGMNPHFFPSIPCNGLLLINLTELCFYLSWSKDLKLLLNDHVINSVKHCVLGLAEKW